MQNDDVFGYFSQIRCEELNMLWKESMTWKDSIAYEFVKWTTFYNLYCIYCMNKIDVTVYD